MTPKQERFVQEYLITEPQEAEGVSADDELREDEVR